MGSTAAGVAREGRVAMAPWHLGFVGGFSLIFNGSGAFGYVMTLRQTRAFHGRAPR